MTRHPGFTIIELLVYMGIVSILLVILTQIFTSVINVQLESSGDTSVTAAANFIFTRLQYDIHRAQNILLPASAGQSASSLQLVIDGVNYTYTHSGSQLQLTTDFGTTLISDSSASVSAFTVSRIGNGTWEDTLRINLTLESVAVTGGGLPQTRQLQTSISLR